MITHLFAALVVQVLVVCRENEGYQARIVNCNGGQPKVEVMRIDRGALARWSSWSYLVEAAFTLLTVCWRTLNSQKGSTFNASVGNHSKRKTNVT